MVARLEDDEPPCHFTAVPVTIEPPFRTLRVSSFLRVIEAVVPELIFVVVICGP
jgi:hypothetical protein